MTTPTDWPWENLDKLRPISIFINYRQNDVKFLKKYIEFNFSVSDNFYNV